MSQRRSVWESRFYALMRNIEFQIEAIKSDVAKLALNGDLSIEVRENYKSELLALERIKTTAREIESQRQTYLWVGDR